MAKNEYVKKIKLELNDKEFRKSKNKIDVQLEDLEKTKRTINEESEESLKEQLDMASDQQKLEDAINGISQEKLKTTKKVLTAEEKALLLAKQKKDAKIEMFKDVVGRASSKLAGIFTGFVASIGAAMTSAIHELNKMTAYDGSGAFYSEDARDQQMQYGLSDAENYALSKVKDKWDFSDEEYMMGGYNEERSKILEEQLELYRQQYNEMKSSGYLDNIAEMRRQLKEFGEEFQRTIGQFFVDHGDTIMVIMKGMLDALGGILGVVDAIFGWFSDGSQSSYETDSNIQQIIDKGKLTNNNVNINNTMNSNASGVTNVNQLKSVTTENYRNIIRAIGG